MSQLFILIILQALTIVLGLYLAFFKSYIQKKGKNLATQEDIKKITKIIEETKIQFTADTEYLKNRLSLYSQSFQSIKTLERNAIIEVNTKYSELLNSLTTFSLVYYSYENYENLKSKDLYFSEKLMAFNVAEDNLHLYAHEIELMSKKSELIRLTFKLHESVLKHIVSFMLNCSNYNQIRAITKDEDQVALNKWYHDLQQPVINDSIEESKNIILQIQSQHVNFIKILNYKIYQLINEDK